MTDIRVFLVDDHSMFRAGVRAELTGATTAAGEPITIVGEAETVPQAITKIHETSPDVVLLDVHMPDGGGLEVLLNTLDTDARFLVLSVSDSPEDVITLIRAGARGYVTKNTSGPELVSFISRVHSGDAVFSPRLAGYVLDAFSSVAPSPEVEAPSQDLGRQRGGVLKDGAESTGSAGSAGGNQPNLDELTPREHEVLRLLARGYTYKEMAERLFISIKTVETHVSNILRKTQQTNRRSLSRWMERRNS